MRKGDFALLLLFPMTSIVAYHDLNPFDAKMEMRMKMKMKMKNLFATLRNIMQILVHSFPVVVNFRLRERFHYILM